MHLYAQKCARQQVLKLICTPLQPDVFIAAHFRRVTSMRCLNAREREVLSWVAQGKTTWETATILGVSPRTVEWYIKRMRSRVSAANLVHLVAMAAKAGVIGLITSGTGVVAHAARHAAWMTGVMDLIGGPGGSI